MSDLNPCFILCGSCLLRKSDRNLVDVNGTFIPIKELEKLCLLCTGQMPVMSAETASNCSSREKAPENH